MKNLFLLLIVACCSLQLAAQTNLDSLWGVWEDESQADSTRINAFKYYIWNGFLFTDPDTAVVLSEVLTRYGESNNNSEALATALNIQGVAYDNKGEYRKALDYYTRSFKIFEQGGHKKGMANTLNNQGLIYNELGNNPKALSNYKQALKIIEEIGDLRGKSNTLSNIGTVYSDQGSNSKALEYYYESLEILKLIDDQYSLVGSLNNIGICYKVEGDFQKALSFYEQSLEISEKLDYPDGISNTQYLLGNVYYKQGDYTRAMDSYELSLKIDKESDDPIGIAYNLLSIGVLYSETGNSPKAESYCKEALELSQKAEVLSLELSSCECLYEVYKDLKNSSRALEFMEKMNLITESLDAEEATRQLQQMEFEKQMLADSIVNAEEARLIEEAHQEELRQKKRTRNIFGGVGFFALLLAGGFYWRWRYVRKSKAVLQVEKDRSENLLLNILPEEIAEELKEKGRADARDFERVSILFTDFKGFTAASEKLSAQDLVSEINTCFEAFDGIMGKYNIEKIKTIGDAYMAAGGLPVPTDDSVKNTVLAALEMQDFIRDRKAKLDAEGKPGFEMRVGVHTGPVVAGIVGVKKFQYDIWGDTVNTASRMESSGEVGKVNISEATYELLKDDTQFLFESRGKVEAKGKGELEMFFVEKV